MIRHRSNPNGDPFLNAYRRRHIATFIGVLGSVLFVLSTLSFIVLFQHFKSPAGNDWFATEPTVVNIIDGDTIDVRIGRKTQRIRLLGIDTPETKDPRKPVQCYGREASEQAKALLPAGTVVRLAHDLEITDAYERMLAYVWRANDGLFVNLELIIGGFADVLSIAPNTAHADEFRAAVNDAKSANRGLWGTCGGPGRPAS